MEVNGVELMADEGNFRLTVIFSTNYGSKVFYLDRPAIEELIEELARCCSETN